MEVDTKGQDASSRERCQEDAYSRNRGQKDSTQEEACHTEIKTDADRETTDIKKVVTDEDRKNVQKLEDDNGDRDKKEEKRY